MKNNRPELINLNVPKEFENDFNALLKQTLAKAAKLKTTSDSKQTNFAFYPSAGEYLLINIRVRALSEKLGGKEVKKDE
jgi:hypothetical protein